MIETDFFKAANRRGRDYLHLASIKRLTAILWFIVWIYVDMKLTTRHDDISPRFETFSNKKQDDDNRFCCSMISGRCNWIAATAARFDNLSVGAKFFLSCISPLHVCRPIDTIFTSSKGYLLFSNCCWLKQAIHVKEMCSQARRAN